MHVIYHWKHNRDFPAPHSHKVVQHEHSHFCDRVVTDDVTTTFGEVDKLQTIEITVAGLKSRKTGVIGIHVTQLRCVIFSWHVLARPTKIHVHGVRFCHA